MEFALGYTVSVGNNNHEEICARAPKTGNDSKITLACERPLVGQYLKISRSISQVYISIGGNNLLLCEVIIWGVSASYIKLGT